MSCTGRRASPVARTTDFASWHATAKPESAWASPGPVCSVHPPTAASSPSARAAQPSSDSARATRSAPARRIGRSSGAAGAERTASVVAGGGGAGAMLPSSESSSRRRSRLPNWNRSNVSRRVLMRSGPKSSGGTSSRSSSTGASVSITASRRVLRAASACAASASPRLGVCSDAWARISSRLPYFCSSWVAPFSPMPGTPGRLSLGSPTMPRKSVISSGPIPYRSRTASGVYWVVSVTPRPVAITLTRSLTSWNASRSPVRITTGSPARSARRASVPMTSSASKPGRSVLTNPNADISGRKWADCSRKRSGVVCRLAL